MKPTEDSFEPRADGLFPHRGIWDEVTVGTLLAAPRKNEVYQVIATKHPPQVEYGKTLWFRIRNLATGEEMSIPPRRFNETVVILTQTPLGGPTAPPTRPEDTDAIMAVVEGLGASMLATIDNVTGEVTCPDYIMTSHIPGLGNMRNSRGLLEHLQIAHGFDPNVLRPTWTYAEIFKTHNGFHNSRREEYGGGLFPHRHVPEDRSIL